MQTDPPAGVSASPVPDNVMTWNAVIIGPADTPFEDGTFRLVMHFEEQYPNKPPSVKFISQMFHPNVYATGELCLDILQNRWSPTYDVAAVLTSIQRLVDSRRRGRMIASSSLQCGSWLTAGFTVFSMIRTLDRQRMSRRLTCTRTTAKNTPNGFVKRLRRAGKSRTAAGRELHTIRRYQPHWTPSWRRRLSCCHEHLESCFSSSIRRVGVSGLLQLYIPAATAFEQLVSSVPL